MLLVVLSASFAGWISCLVALVLFIMTRQDTVSPTGDAPSGEKPSESVNKTNLPVDTILQKKKSPWNTQYIGNQERMSVKNGVLKIRYGKNAHGASSGAKVSALPLNKFPAETL